MEVNILKHFPDVYNNYKFVFYHIHMTYLQEDDHPVTRHDPNKFMVHFHYESYSQYEEYYQSVSINQEKSLP